MMIRKEFTNENDKEIVILVRDITSDDNISVEIDITSPDSSDEWMLTYKETYNLYKALKIYFDR